MTIIKPLNQTEIALREKVRSAVKKANLNLSETEALNKKFDLGLKYTPKSDIVELTTYTNKNLKTSDFTRNCIEMAEEYGKAVYRKMIPSKTSDYQRNLSRALSKLRKVLK